MRRQISPHVADYRADDALVRIQHLVQNWSNEAISGRVEAVVELLRIAAGNRAIIIIENISSVEHVCIDCAVNCFLDGSRCFDCDIDKPLVINCKTTVHDRVEHLINFNLQSAQIKDCVAEPIAVG